MITDGIREMLIKQAEKAPIDSELRAIVNWITVGRHTAFRSSEWCQASQKNYARIKGWPGKPSLAMVRSDFAFLLMRRARSKMTETSCSDWKQKQNLNICSSCKPIY